MSGADTYVRCSTCFRVAPLSEMLKGYGAAAPVGEYFCKRWGLNHGRAVVQVAEDKQAKLWWDAPNDWLLEPGTFGVVHNPDGTTGYTTMPSW